MFIYHWLYKKYFCWCILWKKFGFIYPKGIYNNIIHGWFIKICINLCFSIVLRWKSARSWSELHHGSSLPSLNSALLGVGVGYINGLKNLIAAYIVARSSWKNEKALLWFNIFLFSVYVLQTRSLGNLICKKLTYIYPI